ncbi:MAG: RHS repeat domain-containing protein [Sulfuricaulis sp.]
MADLIFEGTDNRFWVSLSTGTGFTTPQMWVVHDNGASNSFIPGQAQYADVNGDGMADLIFQGNDNQFWVSLSAGVGGFTTPTSWVQHGGSFIAGQAQYADLNGDGKADLIFQGTDNRFWASFSTGSSFISPAIWMVEGGSFVAGQAQYVDLDGDGRKDLIFQGNDNQFWTSLTNATPYPDLLSYITNGLGVQTVIFYKSLTDSMMYTKGTDAVYPYQDIQDATYVVSQFTQSNGVGGINSTGYTYAGLKRHLTANVSIGFTSVQVTDPAGLVTTAWYNQTLGGTEGTVASSATTYGSRTLKSIVNNWTPQISPSCATCTVAFLASTQEQTWDLDGTVFPSVTTSYSNPDTFWNPQTITVSTSDGYTKTTSNVYNNDTTNWYLGQLLQSQVTAHAPGQTDVTRTSSFSYDGVNRLLTETIEPSQSAFTVTTTYGDDSFGNRVSKTVSGTGIATRSESQPYDARGQFPASKTNALNQTEIYNSYDARTGALTSMTGPNNLTTTWIYDGFGRKTQENRADGTWTIYSYQLCGSGFYCPPLAVTAVGTQSSGASIVWTYQDMLGRLVRTAHVGFGNAWVYQDTAYDNLGRVVKVSEPSFNDPPTIFTTSIPDALGRPISVTVPGNRTTTTTYSGLTTSVTNPLNQTRTVVKNSQGQVMQATDAGGTTYYQYDGFGDQTQLTDVANNVTTMTYDLRGRKIAMHDPDMGNWSYTYDALGELISQKDAKNQTISMVYDKLGRMTSRTTPEGTSNWTYDTSTYGIGKLALMSGPDGNSESYSYDSLGRPSSVTTSIGGATYTVATSYDAASRVATVTYPNNGFELQYYYDPNQYGFLTEIKNATTGASYWKINPNGVDAHNRITSEIFGNGLTTAHDYDPNTGYLLDIRTGVGGAAGVQNLAYVFDSIGNLSQRIDNNQGGLSEQYGYDGLNRLTSVSGPAPKTYQYAVNGNLTYKSDVGAYTYPTNGTQPHAVSSIAGTLNTSFTYDANGNQLTGNGKTLTYTSFNKANTISANGQTDTLSYDANFNRIVKSNSNGTTVYIGKLYERISSGTSVTQKNYLFAGNIAVGVYTVNSDGTSNMRYFHTDHLGSIDTITDESGNVVQHLSYDAHGKRRNPNWTDATTTIISLTTRGFTRHEMDDEIGLINMNAREYDPILGRFITPDTIVQTPFSSQGLNRYSYANNNPLSYWDPTGHGWFKKLRKAVQNIVHAQTQLIFHPSVRNIFNLVQSQPGMHYVDKSLMRDKWAREGLMLASSVCGPVAPACAAGAASYTTMLMGGSSTDAFRSGAVAWGSSAAFKTVDSWKTMSLADAGEKIISSGVIGGITSKLQGGNFNDGFESSVISTAARIAWSTIVETQTGVPGGCEAKCVEARPGLEPLSGYTNKPLSVALMDPAANNFSFKVLPGDSPTLGSEGGLFSIIADHIPGMNAVADMHDALNPSDIISGAGGHVWFVGSMVISAGVSYSALQYGYHYVDHQ